MTSKAILKDLLVESKDGEWGKAELISNHQKMLVIRGTDFSTVRFGSLKGVPTRFIPDHIAKRKCLHPADILIETAGGTKDQPTGRTVFLKDRLLEHSPAPLTCSSFTRFLRVNPDLADPEYIFWFLQFLYESGRLESHQVQHTGIARFQYTKFSETARIPLPPLPEQRAIAHILGTLDDKIELNRRMNETLEAMAQALFKSWFVDFDPVRAKAEGRNTGLTKEIADLFPDGFEDSELGEIPRGWEATTVGEVFELNPTEKLPKGNIAPYLDMATVPTHGSYPDLPILRPFISGSKYRNGDTLFARITPCLENGKTAFIQSLQENEIACGSTEFIVIRPKEPFPKEFGYLLARDSAFREHAIQSMSGTSGRQRVQESALAAFKITEPGSRTLKVFGTLVNSLFRIIKLNSEQNFALAQIRDLLLPKLLSGEIKIQVGESTYPQVGV